MSYQINRWILVLGVIITAIVSVIGVAQAVTPLEYGETISGSIDISTEIDTYTFFADSNDTVIIRIDGPSDHNALNTEIRLYAPNGTLLTSQWNYNNLEMQHTLPENGEYIISVLDYNIEYTGSYNLFIQRLNNPSNTTPIGFGETVSDSIDTSPEIDTYTFSADSNDTVTIRIDGPSAHNALNTEIRLYAPNGTLLTSQWNYNNLEMQHTLPENGEYIISVLDYNIEYTGSYNLFIQRLNNPSNTTPIGFGETVSDSIDTSPEIDTYTFYADSNDTVTIRIDGPSAHNALNTEIRLYAPNGTLLASQWNYNNLEMQNTLPENGEYIISVLDYNIEYTGSYNLFIQRFNNPGSAPFANFTYLPKNPVVNQVIIFNATASYDPNGNIINYKWDFGDGNITSTTEKIITHSYTLEGDYDVSLAITDNSSTTNSTTRYAQVVPIGITIDLYTGWNLISLPLMPGENSIASVLSLINGNYSIIWEYNASNTSDHWKKYDPSVPFGNDLINMEPGKGYWILMTSDDTLPISGTVPESTDFVLKTGWNLIGYNSLDSQPVAEAISSISSNYSIIWTYNASDTTDHWKKYDHPSVPFGNDLIIVEPGKGYWIMMTSDDILET